jgi:hypothetical protein
MLKNGNGQPQRRGLPAQKALKDRYFSVPPWRPKVPLELPLVRDCARKYLYIEYVG